MINVDAYPFFAFTDLTCLFKMQDQVFSASTVLFESKET